MTRTNRAKNHPWTRLSDLIHLHVCVDHLSQLLLDSLLMLEMYPVNQQSSHQAFIAM